MDLRGNDKLQTGHARSLVFPMTFGISRKPESVFEILQLRCFEDLEFSELLQRFKLRLAQTSSEYISLGKHLQPASDNLGHPNLLDLWGGLGFLFWRASGFTFRLALGAAAPAGKLLHATAGASEVEKPGA